MLQVLFAVLLISSSCVHSSDFHSPASTPTTDAHIRLFLWLDMYNFTEFRVITSVEIRAVNLHELNSTLPEKYIYADEIRANLSLGLFSVAQIERVYLNEIVENLTGYLSDRFGTNYTVAREWNAQSLSAPAAPPSEEPPLIYYINYTQNVWIGEGIDEELLTGILNDGAVYTRVFTPLPTKYPSAVNLTLPRGAAIPGFPFPTNGTWKGRHYYVWSGDKEVNLGITGASGKSYKRSNVNVSVVIDMHTLANVGGNEYLYTSINISADVHVLAIPDELKKELPESVKMNFIGADAVRLIIAKNVVNLTYLYDTLNATLEAGKEKLLEMFNNRVDFRTQPLENLTWAGNPFEMDENPPVHLSIRGNSTLDFGEYVKNYRQGLSLTYTYSLNLLAIEGFNISYTVVFPKNIQVVQVECGAPHEKHYVNGRDAVSVMITNSSEMLRILIRISFDLDFERVYPFIVLLAIFIGIWIAVSIMAYQKKRVLR
ncbi:MAG: hypothetical protein N3F63_07110 [Thermoplasmata archaeon]|nr:hypothetical protein [Thermoplasmata archaeon]